MLCLDFLGSAGLYWDPLGSAGVCESLLRSLKDNWGLLKSAEVC